MQNIYVFSGPCGCGKSTLADAYAAHIIRTGVRDQIYVIHGDAFHRGVIETDHRVGSECPGFLYWNDILQFNWACILSVGQLALERGLDLIVDYVVEDELPLIRELAERNHARLFYIVLTASEETLTARLAHRGNPELTERSLFLKRKLEQMHENAGHMYDVTGKTLEQEIELLNISQYEMKCISSRFTNRYES